LLERIQFCTNITESDDKICGFEKEIEYTTDQQLDEQKFKRTQLKDALYSAVRLPSRRPARKASLLFSRMSSASLKVDTKTGTKGVKKVIVGLCLSSQ
jgi:hypothetical protein